MTTRAHFVGGEGWLWGCKWEKEKSRTVFVSVEITSKQYVHMWGVETRAKTKKKLGGPLVSVVPTHLEANSRVTKNFPAVQG